MKYIRRRGLLLLLLPVFKTSEETQVKKGNLPSRLYTFTMHACVTSVSLFRLLPPLPHMPFNLPEYTKFAHLQNSDEFLRKQRQSLKVNTARQDRSESPPYHACLLIVYHVSPSIFSYSRLLPRLRRSIYLLLLLLFIYCSSPIALTATWCLC